MGAPPLKAGHSKGIEFLPDALGTVRDVVDDTGSVIRSMEFQEHGQLLNSSGSGTISPKTYQGGLSVNDDRDDSGLYLMGNRHFESARLGRFISRDPIGFAGGLNLFNGHSTSPVTMVDPSGLDLIIDNSFNNSWQTKTLSSSNDRLYAISKYVREGVMDRLIGDTDVQVIVRWKSNIRVNNKDGSVTQAYGLTHSPGSDLVEYETDCDGKRRPKGGVLLIDVDPSLAKKDGYSLELLLAHEYTHALLGIFYADNLMPLINSSADPNANEVIPNQTEDYVRQGF